MFRYDDTSIPSIDNPPDGIRQTHTTSPRGIAPAKREAQRAANREVREAFDYWRRLDDGRNTRRHRAEARRAKRMAAA